MQSMRGKSGKFDKDNWFTSVTLIANSIMACQLIVAGLTNDNKHQQSEKDWTRIISGTLRIVVDGCLFFSNRSVEPPQGETMLERMKYSFQNPSKSALHFTGLLSAPINLLLCVGGIVYGLKGSDKERSTRFITAGAGALSVGLITTSLYEKKEHNPPKNAPIIIEKEKVDFMHANSKIIGGTRKLANIKEMAKYGWESDKKGLIGRVFAVAFALGMGIEGALTQGNPKKAASLMTGAFIGATVGVAELYYTYDMLLKSEKSGANKVSPAAAR